MNIIDAFWTLNDPYLFNNFLNITTVLETRSTVTTEKFILNHFTYNCYLPSEESTMVSLAPLLSNTSQSLTVLSHEPLASRALLELKLSELTGPSCPASTCYQIQLNCKFKFMYNVNRKMFVNFFGGRVWSFSYSIHYHTVDRWNLTG